MNQIATYTAGKIEYTLTRKPVKNINLRIKPDGTIVVSASKQVSLKTINKFISSKSDWIETAQQRVKEKVSVQLMDKWSNDECLAVFQPISDEIYPLFADVLKNKPLIKVRLMKSRWGVCHVVKKYITLNKALMDKPPEAIQYVILHEYVHFIHPNHQKKFHDTMQKLMPDYKLRRKLLK